eukprot:238582-Rhodomonas_salina.1
MYRCDTQQLYYRVGAEGCFRVGDTPPSLASTRQVPWAESPRARSGELAMGHHHACAIVAAPPPATGAVV